MNRSLVLASCLFLACANQDAGNPDSGGSTFDSNEQTAFDSNAPSIPALLELAEVADSFFQFDPTLDPTQTDSQNASLIADHVTQNLGASGDGGALCGSVSVSGTTVTADFGSLPGCTLANGAVISGTIAVTVTKTGSSLAVAFQFTNATVNGTALGGSATFTTSDGSSFTLNANVTWGTSSFGANAFTVSGASGSITLNGTITNGGDAQSSLTFASVVWKLGDCYPDAGTLTIDKGIVTETMTFDAQSATSGQVVVTIGKKSVNTLLPTYGKCGKGDAG